MTLFTFDLTSLCEISKHDRNGTWSARGVWSERVRPARTSFSRSASLSSSLASMFPCAVSSSCWSCSAAWFPRSISDAKAVAFSEQRTRISRSTGFALTPRPSCARTSLLEREAPPDIDLLSLRSVGWSKCCMRTVTMSDEVTQRSLRTRRHAIGHAPLPIMLCHVGRRRLKGARENVHMACVLLLAEQSTRRYCVLIGVIYYIITS